MPHEAAWAREMATIDAYRLVRRRGWWMLLFGFVHGIVFPGDIIAPTAWSPSSWPTCWHARTTGRST